MKFGKGETRPRDRVLSATDAVGTLADAGDRSSEQTHLHVGLRKGDLYLALRIAYGFGGIDDQIHDHLLQLSWIGAHQARFAGQAQLERDRRSGEARVEAR